MSRRPIVSVSNDFSTVIAFLKEQKIIPEKPSAALLGNAKKIHEDTYSLILWRFRLRNLTEHSKNFIEEIASDALQILPQIMMGYSKTAKLLVRGILENTLRHIYFSDHPVEFARMNRETKWFLTADQLFDYARNYPEFIKTENKFDAIAQLSSLYSQLSAGIHGRTVRDLEMRAALKKIIYDEKSAKKEAELLHKCTAACNFLLAVFHRPRVRKFGSEDRAILFRALPRKARKTWTEHE